MVFNSKKFGFTLSEVMITLSLIGVLATLTISTVGSSIQQRARTSEFRAAYAKLETALRSVTIDDGKVYRCYYKPTSDDIENYGLNKFDSTAGAATDDCSTLEEAFSKALGRTKVCITKPQENHCIPPIYVADTTNFKKNDTDVNAYIMDNGMILWVSNKGIRLFAIDINGRSAPNKWGQDLFPFMIKVTETKTIGDKIFPVALSILAPPTSNQNMQPAVSKAGKTTEQMLKDSANLKD